MSSPSQHTEGTDGTVSRFEERLWPGMGVLIFFLTMSTSLGIAYGHAYTAPIGLTVAIVTTVVIFSVAFFSAPLVRVDNLVLRVGRARLPLAYVGDLRILDQVQTRSALASATTPPPYLMVKSWIPRSVVVTVLDESDPHPYWQVSSRNPTELVKALELAKDDTGGNRE